MTRSTSFSEGRTLVIETATEACSIALFDAGALIEARCEMIGRGHAEHLIPMIAELRDGGHADHVLVGCGPGSFTGIRVGVAAARALALGWGAQVSGYSTIALIAAQGFRDNPEIQSLCVAMRGGHGEFFTQCFSHAPFAERSSLLSQVPDSAARGIETQHIIGNAAAALIEARGFGDLMTSQVRAEGAEHLPVAFLQLAPSPLYVRGADAKPMA